MINIIKNKKEYFCVIIYFVFLFPVYLNDWVVPDFTLYSGFAQAGLKAKDGFSTLFLFIAGFSTISPKLICVICLGLLGLGIFSFIYFYKNNMGEKLPPVCSYLFLFILFSSGIWYYFYGKIFYEFPFIIANYGICLILMSKIYSNYYKNNNIDFKVYYLSFSIGLCISWKIHSVFLILGTFLLVCCNDKWRKILVTLLFSISMLLKSILCIFIGYILGNYGIFIDYKETLQGIKAYPAQSEFVKRLFNMDFIVWDHVNIMPWNISVINILTCIWIGILIPIIIKKYRYILVSMTIVILFGFISSTNSVGYTWQGFPIGAFFITLFLFLLLEFDVISTKLKKIFIVGSTGVFIIQSLITFGFYIPKQATWYQNTQNSIKILTENEEAIRNDTINFINSIGDHTFGINIAIKRFYPVQLSPIILNVPNKSNPYILSLNKQYTDPLSYANLDIWNKIYSFQNFRGYSSPECEYMIYIIPNNFKTMNDIADINAYLNLSPITSYDREEYSIRLIKMERNE